jgi:Ala-tRNA(Pro) deacylase
MAVSSEELMQRLGELGIASTTVVHPPVFTVDQAKQHRAGAAGTHIKNLFLRNKKGAMWLVVLQEDRSVDLKELGKRVGAGNLSFASHDRLRRHLGVEPGAVTPFAVINDGERLVTVVLDRRVLGCDPVHCHPLTNDKTTAVTGSDLLRFLGSTGHEPRIVDLDEP